MTPLAARAGDAPRWLVLASPRAGFIGTLAKRAAETTAPLLVAMERLKEVAYEQELAVRGALLDEVLAGGDVASLTARAAAFDLDFAEPARVVLASGDTRCAAPRARRDAGRHPASDQRARRLRRRARAGPARAARTGGRPAAPASVGR